MDTISFKKSHNDDGFTINKKDIRKIYYYQTSIHVIVFYVLNDYLYFFRFRHYKSNKSNLLNIHKKLGKTFLCLITNEYVDVNIFVTVRGKTRIEADDDVYIQNLVDYELEQNLNKYADEVMVKSYTISYGAK